MKYSHKALIKEQYPIVYPLLVSFSILVILSPIKLHTSISLHLTLT